MRILKVTQAYYPFLDMGGPALKVRGLARSLVQRGHHVTVLTADLGLDQSLGLSASVEPNAWGWRSCQDGVETIYLRTRARYRAMTLNPDVIRFSQASLGDFDLVHIYGLYDLLGPAVASLSRRRDIPYVVEPMGMTRPIDRGFWLKRLWHVLLGNRVLQGASLLIATSEQEQRELITAGFPPERVRVRYNGLDLEEFRQLPPRGSFRRRWQIEPNEPLILFFGRLIPRKGADLLLEAFATAFSHTGRLVIAGPEGEPGYLQTLAKKARALGIDRRVAFTGPLYGADKNAALADADIFALPSRYENFANAAAEAMACGTPVIVTESCGISALVSQGAGLVIPRSERALTQGLRELTANTALYSRLQAGCYNVVAQISWEELGGRMEDYYTHVLAERAP